MTNAVINDPEIITEIVVMVTAMDAMGISVQRMMTTITVYFLGVCQAQRIWS